MTVTKWWT